MKFDAFILLNACLHWNKLARFSSETHQLFKYLTYLEFMS